jgi:exodeoxyribonuclease VII large subunit
MAETKQLGLSFAAPARTIYPVKDLVAAVRTSLERAFLDVYVEGEVSNFRPAGSGHVYFTLKDSVAQLRVVLWRTQARLLRFRPDNGMQVIVRGRVTVYDERGDLQLQAEYIEPKGVGTLQLAVEQLKAKLAAEGLFDTSRKKPIPAVPRRIGLVTSPRAAALRDILNILQRRHETVNVLIYPAQVQGEEAASELALGVRFLNRSTGVDVIILARGGGSFEDLFAFNDEGLARTIAGSKVPVISAVGHETDFTICDFVADRRAATPSEAAELVVAAKAEIEERVSAFHKRLIKATQYRLLLANTALARLQQHPAFVRMSDSIARREQSLDERVYRLVQAHARNLSRLRRQMDALDSRLRHRDVRLQLGEVRRGINVRQSEMAVAITNLLRGRMVRLERLDETLAHGMRNLLVRRRSDWTGLKRSLHALSPRAILGRGYALVFDEAGALVKEASQLKPREVVRTELGSGRFTSEVREVEEEERQSDSS